MADRSNVHWTHCDPASIVRVNSRWGDDDAGNEFLEKTRQGFGAYLCAQSAGARPDAVALTALVERLGLVNEFVGKPTGERVRGISAASRRRRRQHRGR
jgi:hypothetical protein